MDSSILFFPFCSLSSATPPLVLPSPFFNYPSLILFLSPPQPLPASYPAPSILCQFPFPTLPRTLCPFMPLKPSTQATSCSISCFCTLFYLILVLLIPDLAPSITFPNLVFTKPSPLFLPKLPLTLPFPVPSSHLSWLFP